MAGAAEDCPHSSRSTQSGPNRKNTPKENWPASTAAAFDRNRPASSDSNSASLIQATTAPSS